MDGPDFYIASYLEGVVTILATDDEDGESDALWLKLFPASAVSDAKREEMKAAFRGAYRPTVILAYPRSRAKWPVWAVVLEQEHPEEEYLAGFEDVDPDNGEQSIGVYESQSLQIMVITEGNPEVARWQCNVVKRTLLAALPFMMADPNGPSEFHYRGMTDLVPDQRYLPEELVGRTQRWSFSYEDEVVTAIEYLHGPVMVASEGYKLNPSGTVRGGVRPMRL